MTVKLDEMGMNSVHSDWAAEYKSMSRKPKRKAKKNLVETTPVMGRSRNRRRKGLNMKIAADGSMSIKHMSELGNGLAFMPPVEIDLTVFSETSSS